MLTHGDRRVRTGQAIADLTQCHVHRPRYKVAATDTDTETGGAYGRSAIVFPLGASGSL